MVLADLNYCWLPANTFMRRGGLPSWRTTTRTFQASETWNFAFVSMSGGERERDGGLNSSPGGPTSLEL